MSYIAYFPRKIIAYMLYFFCKLLILKPLLKKCYFGVISLTLAPLNSNSAGVFWRLF
jgi:hypothetical protein